MEARVAFRARAMLDYIMTNEGPPVIVSSEVPIEELDDPALLDFLAYWERLRGEHWAPSWAAFDLLGLDLAAIPRVAVVDVLRDPLDFKYRFWGTAHVQNKGVELTGKRLGAAPRLRGGTPVEEYTAVAEQKRPLASRAVISLAESERRLPFDQAMLRLPLSNDGDRVDHVISMASWKRV